MLITTCVYPVYLSNLIWSKIVQRLYAFFFIVSRTLTMRSISLTTFKMSAYMIVDRRTKLWNLSWPLIRDLPLTFHLVSVSCHSVLWVYEFKYFISYDQSHAVLRLCDGVILYSRIYWRSVCAAIHCLIFFSAETITQSMHLSHFISFYTAGGGEVACTDRLMYTVLWWARECHCHMAKIRDFRIIVGKNWYYSKMFLVS